MDVKERRIDGNAVMLPPMRLSASLLQAAMWGHDRDMYEDTLYFVHR